MARKLVVEFVGDSKNLEKTFSNVRGASDKTGGSLSKLKGPATTAGIAIGGGLALAAKAGFDELKEGQQVSAQTAAMLKSTGGAANLSAKDMETLAGAISAKSGIDDEAIQSGENLLGTFTNIRNETGKGNDVFSQATGTMADMSVALGQDMKSSAMQLGKALNDPVKGMTALQRVGVTFTDAQKKQVEAMVKSGDTMGAQKLILKELNKEFGGSAKAAGDTLPGQMNKLSNSFSGLAGSIVSSLVPAMQSFAGIAAKVAGFLQEHPTLAKVLITVLGGLAAAVVAVNTATKAWTAIETIASVLRMKAVGQWIANTAAIVAQNVAMIAANVATKAWAIAQGLLNIVMAANPITLVVIAVAALVAGFIIAYKHSESFRAIIDSLWQMIKGFAGWLATVAVAAFKVFSSALQAVFNGLKTYIKTVFGIYKTIITGAWTAIKTVSTTVWNAIKTAVTTVWNGIKLAATTVFGLIKTAIMTPIRQVRDGLIVIWTAIRTVASAAWGKLKETASTLWNGLKTVILTPIRFVRDKVGDIWDALTGRLSRGFQNIKDKAVQFGTDIKNAIVGGFAWAINKVIDGLNVLIKAFNKLPGPNIGPIGHLAVATGGVVGAARGGAFGRTHGLIRAPMMLMGEEAPRHPEIVIPTNPAYRKRARALTMTAAGAIGMAQGGITPYTGGMSPDAGGVVVQVNVASGMEWLRNYIDVRIVERDRATAGVYNAGVS